ncbi:GyrI-like domain-containing protein [Formosa sp. L2A11]|uniref:GyrI-like domain-containing protein n=1 Tax=Formosa sp. L2A11 TaxID=2686363 RepID=UPI00131B7ABA|nr:GyrI-like domain-containing protein [Formosa sp. L2A11]
MKPRIEILEHKKLIGYSFRMSLINNKTQLLWASFSPKIKDIKNKLTTDKISMQVYDSSYFENFNPETEFEKWATVEVLDFNNIPEDLDFFNLEGGKYAVFDYKGSSKDNSIFQYIFRTWLPNSEYELDNRPHFEILGEKYKNNNPDSEEEIWIPIKNIDRA